MATTVRMYREDDRVPLERCIGLLQDFVARLDPLQRIRRLKDFDAHAYVSRSLEEVRTRRGAIYVAEDGNDIIGCVIGVIHEEDPEDIEGYPSTDGRILELIVSPEYRGKNVGLMLMQRIEEYLQSHGCDAIQVDCFGPNADAHKFYEKLGYTDRLVTLIKPLKPHPRSTNSEDAPLPPVPPRSGRTS
jgi:ribosomal protein S18 acetylase RimI-like enzyme